ncbi:divalent cation tolerance protein CutA [Virgibacillus pantothenticus]|uniref:divalent cation tolerance protein CutA n=1 Tax=Virgibacillus pantothenticus TaxID=1473 RepID=UPI0009861057|nr:divalent cation tolerance protein CutA [Virgibacillus pantothenticus]
MKFEYIKFEVLLPEDYIVPLRNELNKYGYITVGDYDHVVSYSETKGYWRPLEASNPFEGKTGNIANGSECKMEFKTPFENIEEVKTIIKSIHPYEEPIINVVPLLS